MLTAAQCAVTAFYVPDEGPVCEACARAAYGTHSIDRAKEGLSSPVEPLIAYMVGEEATAEAENNAEYIAQEHGPPTDWDFATDGRDALVTFEDGHSEKVASVALCTRCDAELED